MKARHQTIDFRRYTKHKESFFLLFRHISKDFGYALSPNSPVKFTRVTEVSSRWPYIS